MLRSAMGLVLLTLAGVDWQPFSPPGGGFSALMPGQATEQKQRVGASDLFLYDAVLPNSGIHCVIGYTEFPANSITPGTEDKRLDNARDQAVKAAKGKLLREKSIVLLANPGRELSIAIDGKPAVLMRIFAVKNRLYQVAVVGVGEGGVTPDAAKFLDSFKLAK